MAALAVLVADQLSKFFVYGYWLFRADAPITIISNFLYIKSVQNTGIGFGLLKGSNSAIIWLTIIFIGIIIYYFDDIAESRLSSALAGLLIGGAAGNLMDRVFLGFVRDFISFTFWPAFNAADAAISIGGIGLIAYFLSKKK